MRFETNEDPSRAYVDVTCVNRRRGACTLAIFCRALASRRHVEVSTRRPARHGAQRVAVYA
jgi:hypothetical protein